MKNKDQKEPQKLDKHEYAAASECGTTHSDCINTWKGSCNLEAGHSGSHHCSSCGMVF